MSAMMANFIALANYFKTTNIILSGAPRHSLAADKGFQSRIAYGIAESSKLFAHTFGDQLDSTVGQIAHGAGDFKSGGDGFRGVAESNTLHMAGIKNFHAAAACN